MLNFVKDFLAAADLVMVRLRRLMAAVTYVGLAFQGMIITGQIQLPPGARWTNAVAFGSILLGYWTHRGPKEVINLVEAKRLDGEPPMPGVHPVSEPRGR